VESDEGSDYTESHRTDENVEKMLNPVHSYGSLSIRAMAM
jgi:hypothetical protein